MQKVFIFNNIVSEKNCDLLIQQYQQYDFQQAQIRTNKGDEKVYDHNIRKVHTLNLPHENHKDLLKDIYHYIDKANNSYQYDINHQLSDDLLLLKYEAGCHFKPHLDIAAGQASFRKISFILQLSPPESYLGADLVFYPDQSAPRQQGSLIIFPSNMMHMVTPLITGIRYTIVGWVTGETGCVELIVSDTKQPQIQTN